MENLMLKIKETELEAEEIVKSAKKEIIAIANEAEKTKKIKKAEILKESNNAADKVIDEKKVLGQFETKRILEESEQEIKRLSAIANANNQKAVKYIFNLI